MGIKHFPSQQTGLPFLDNFRKERRNQNGWHGAGTIMFPELTVCDCSYRTCRLVIHEQVTVSICKDGSAISSTAKAMANSHIRHDQAAWCPGWEIQGTQAFFSFSTQPCTRHNERKLDILLFIFSSTFGWK